MPTEDTPQSSDIPIVSESVDKSEDILLDIKEQEDDKKHFASIEKHIDQCVFHSCTEQNTKRCRKCNRPFCIMHCNHYSPNFCQDCFKDISIVADKFKRTFDYIGSNGQLFVKTEENVRYYLDGPDWPFVMPWIETLSDDELKIMWVFHHSIMRAIELENDTRKTQGLRKLRETPTPRLTTQTVSKIKKVTKVQVPETPEQLVAKWRKMKLPEATIKMMLAALEQKP